MMEQYVATKEKYKDCILFYRLGDFYEMFFDDAILASKELEITLTGKDCGMEERAPMCGIPFHAADTYINQLVKKGYKVAIGEQVEDPKLAKGLVKREVIRIVTPGTNLSSESLEESKNNYLMCISYVGKNYGISVTDLSTGVFKTCQIQQAEKVVDEINKFQPSEVLYQAGVEQVEEIHAVCERLQVSHTEAPDYYFNLETDEETLKRQFHINSIEGLGLKDSPACVASCGALMQYLHETQMSSLSHINHIETYSVDSFMILDSATRRNLELTETLRDKQKRGSLLWVLDKTKTAMGARKLREFVEQPLLYKDAIEKRLDAIEAINKELIVREELREYLNTIYDLERLLTRIALKTANPRDLLAFKTSIQYLPDIYNLLRELPCERINEIYEDYDSLEDLYDLLEQAIVEEPPVSIKEGGIFKQGYRDEIDELRLAKTECKTWLADLESKEREKTGIKGLKIKYNKVFDYYFEVTNSFKSLVPDYFIRKQTLVNAERFTTDELNTLSGKILGAEDKLYALEYDCYVELREKLAAALVRVQKMAGYIAELDALCSLAYVADKNNYVRPSLNTDGVIDIKGGRHPVVEKMLANDSFVENDTYLNNAESRISIITGPNMAGKSTYMRQTALITLMAQIGSFVPAESANIGLCDRIFTRVGASDDLASGQSTFMIEMNEVANILRNATKDSLLILDEIGRGTSTFDGLSIAWAVVEYIADPNILGAKTLFATHYHELTELEGKLSSVNNFCIAVQEEGDDIVFLRKIIKGGADRSYGIQVARLAGVPEPVLKRAREICNELIDSDITTKVKDIDIKPALSEQPKKKETRSSDYEQLSLFSSPVEMTIANELKTMDLNNMTPIKAMLYLQELQERLKQQ
ncbi:MULTISPECIES: DNA mismatch repair protein MutS [Lachnospiraceae]|uniref:DNA mismatch repair protein MutS n=1 Tax=Coprococcus hominis (ex Arizal et al. 2022) TaxID=2881262 RepID=A0ABS8FKG5_9FIRM|nr:DNA mismatch repair protein MutS [Coprococcus hominis (ex Arizal et al. 2022)]MBP8720543.1 DNA mismatch repair protein MutS [Lachnospiraceae bacterium]MCC2217613.1 DNA mismatch repair protein MutS [Coprococcus hominis (ex Arizal et al. 2022)]MED9930625.1 DNA mismatch repair protein MutS [Lachnospiraceae bacterium]HCS97092.1 DNA mismatch repair protein MutS [Lachnospiraceae bacterium]